jgi:hypothetical protein
MYCVSSPFETWNKKALLLQGSSYIFLEVWKLFNDFSMYWKSNYLIKVSSPSERLDAAFLSDYAIFFAKKIEK